MGDRLVRIATLTAAAALAASVMPAFAADVMLPESPVSAPFESAPRAPSWSGFYLGALFGYNWGNGDTEAVTTDEIDLDGVEAGAFAGANLQLDRFILGAEADVLALGSEGSSEGFELDQGLNGSLRARAGIALDRFLLYGTGGVAATRLEVSEGGESDDNTLVGWTAGLGGEALVTENVSARVEYRYTDYQDKTFTVGSGRVDADLNTHSVRAGVGFKF